MKAIVASVLIVTGVVVGQHMDRSKQMHDASARTYEHLATAIIEIRGTEDSLVEGILRHSHALAQEHLAAAASATGTDQTHHLEMAAEEVTNIANEGDKSVQAIRQRLLKAGHHHHTDSETKDDYMFIDSKEKKELLSMAQKIAKLTGPAAGITRAAGDLSMMFDRAIASQ